MPSAMMSRQMPSIVESATPPASILSLTRSTVLPKSSGRNTYAAVAPAVNRYAAKRRRLWFHGNRRIRTSSLIRPGLCPRQDPSSIYEGRQTERGHRPPINSLEFNTLTIQYTPIRRAFKVFRVLFFGKFFSVFGGVGQRQCAEGWMGCGAALRRRSTCGQTPSETAEKCAILCHSVPLFSLLSNCMVSAAFGKSCHRRTLVLQV